jgi:hypothetical protein
MGSQYTTTITLQSAGHHLKRQQPLVPTIVLPLTPLRTLNISLLDNKDTTVNRVDNNKARLESVRRPCTSVPQGITAAGLDIIRRVDVKVRNLLDLGAVGEARDGGDVEDAETGLIVGLVVKAVVDVLVVVDGAGRRLVVTGNNGLLEVLDVPDICDRETILGGGVDRSAVGVDLALVELIVHHNVGLPKRIEDPTLMGVRGADVGSARDDGTSGAKSLLVGYIVDGQGVLVVAVADVAAVVFLVGSTVDDALSIVCVTVLAGASLNVRLGGVVQVDEHRSTVTGVVATHSSACTTSYRVTLLFVCNYGVRAALDTLVDVDKSNVLLDVESLGVLGRKLEQLLQIEDLDMVANTLRANNQAVANDLDLAPDDGVIVRRKTTDVFQLTLLGKLRERSTVGLTDGNLEKVSLSTHNICDMKSETGCRLTKSRPLCDQPHDPEPSPTASPSSS